ncbi:MAG: hypothetical protein ABI054_11255 [Planctomycetota bacterium]
MTPEEFRDSLHDGLGRALRQAASVPMLERREILLDACLHNRAIDPQLDSDRSSWLLEIIDEGRDFDWIAPRIVAEIPALEHDWDVVQALQLLVHLAKRGVEGAREALIAEFDRQRFRNEWGALQLVLLDGIPGFLHAARRIGKRALEDEDDRIDDELWNRAAELVGDAELATALESAAGSDPFVARYAAGVAAHREQRSSLKPSSPDFWSSYDFDAVRAYLDDPRRAQIQRFAWLVRWGQRVATDSDLERVLLALVAERRPVRQSAWLRVFDKRPMLRFEPLTLALLDSPDEDVSWFAHRALGRIAHPELRRIALERLRAGTVDAKTVRLLLENYRLEDEPLLFAGLPTGGDREDLHALAVSVNDILARHGTAADSRLSTWSYEHSGCTHCRREALERLLTLRCAPRGVLEESRFDSSEDIRKLAGGALADAELSTPAP